MRRWTKEKKGRKSPLVRLNLIRGPKFLEPLIPAFHLEFFDDTRPASAAATPVRAASPVILSPFTNIAAAGSVLLVCLSEGFGTGGPHRRHEAPPEVAHPRRCT